MSVSPCVKVFSHYKLQCVTHLAINNHSHLSGLELQDVLAEEGMAVYGVTAGINAGNGVMVEFFWLQQNSELRNKDVIFNPYERVVLDDITINHYQFGAVQNIGYDDLKPFIGGSLGWSTFTNNDKSEPLYDCNSTFTVSKMHVFLWF